MSGVARVSTRISPPTGRRPRAGTVSNDELRNRRHAGDFSHFAPTLLENECRLPPDYNKDLPSIPSASAAVCMEMVDSPTPSPTVGYLPIPGTPRHVYEQVLIERHNRSLLNICSGVAAHWTLLRAMRSLDE